MSRASRDKGNRTERAIVRLLQERGFAAEKISGMYKPGSDISIPLLGVDRRVEVKCRRRGFGQLYAWLNGAEFLIIKADRREPLIVLPLKVAAEIAGIAERAKAIPPKADSPPDASGNSK
jgi:Holliday junction resolvase